MRRMAVTFVVVLVATLTVAGVYAAVSSRADAATGVPPGWTPRPGTIVAVTGDPANGFRIDRYDGRVEFTPTRSEALAECGEYARTVVRVRCRTAIRVRYRTLRATVSALRYQQWSDS